MLARALGSDDVASGSTVRNTGSGSSTEPDWNAASSAPAPHSSTSSGIRQPGSPASRRPATTSPTTDQESTTAPRTSTSPSPPTGSTYCACLGKPPPPRPCSTASPPTPERDGSLQEWPGSSKPPDGRRAHRHCAGGGPAQDVYGVRLGSCPCQFRAAGVRRSRARGAENCLHRSLHFLRDSGWLGVTFGSTSAPPIPGQIRTEGRLVLRLVMRRSGVQIPGAAPRESRSASTNLGD